MDEKLLHSFSALISGKTGLLMRGLDLEGLKKAVVARTGAMGLGSPYDYYDFLKSGSGRADAEIRELPSLLTVGESYFFRDSGQFGLLKDRLLPELIKRQGTEKRLRIWSAGCSTGEEPYSIAMLLDGLLPERAAWDILIFATDMRKDLLDKAARGLYGQWSFRMTAGDVIKKYFAKQGDGFELKEEIRNMVSFRQENLLNGANPPFTDMRGMDLILCRNLFIYYKKSAIRAMANRLAEALKPGGWLITGHCELFGAAPLQLKPVVYPESIVYERMSEAACLKPLEEKAVEGRVAPAIKAAPVRTMKTETAAAVSVGAQAVIEEAEALLEGGSYDKAAEKAREALSVNHGGFRALYVLGAACANKGRLEDAETYLKKAAAADRLSPSPHYMLAQVAEERNDLRLAKAELEKAIYLDPSYAAAYLELASIHEGEGDLKSAQRNRLAALVALKGLPKEKAIEACSGLLAGELVKYVERLLEPA
ncbi:MAG: tetratricopeptide repeat protein [Deltaproteobacteria bacterium]|nr:tetratricopeptide repeat protein [Deltaproteobacteria bacterium]